VRVSVLVGSFVVAAAACGRNADVAPVAAVDYVGDRPCLSCHTAKAGYLETAHHETSRWASSASIAGSFEEDERVLPTPNPYLHFRMEATERGFFQTAVTGPPGDVTERSERFDIVIGSGRKGQSYLYWQGDQLFQLPVSYWTELDSWINSPGYPTGAANFERGIEPRCLECHATHIESVPGAGDPAGGPASRYDRATFLPSISCEACHGPGREHVTRTRAGRPALPGTGIVNPATLSRAICASLLRAVRFEMVDTHPIRLVSTDDGRRSRLTVFFRFLLVIPHWIWLALWAIAAAVVVILNWFATLFAGRSPQGFHDFLARYHRYTTHVSAYGYRPEGGRIQTTCVLVATGVNAEGHREILTVDIGSAEDGATWTAFLRGLVARGLSGVKLVVSDCHLGLKQAIAAVLDGASWQRCRTHFMLGGCLVPPLRPARSVRCRSTVGHGSISCWPRAA
jgi:hypothetical protein